MRIYGAAFRWPLVSTVLGRAHTVAARALVHTSPVIPALSVSVTRLGSRLRLTLGLAVGAGVLVQPTANCTPKKRKAVEVVPTFATEAEANQLPIAVATPMLHAVDATERGPRTDSGRKTSRVYEAFGRDSADSSICICQSIENTADGSVCGQRIADYTSSLWTHLKGRHPVLWAKLKGIGSDGSASASGDPVTASSASQAALEASAKLSCVVPVSYKQMVEALSAAPPDTLTEAIEALEEARMRRIQETSEGFLASLNS